MRCDSPPIASRLQLWCSGFRVVASQQARYAMKLWKFKSLTDKGLLHVLQMLTQKQVFLPNCELVNDSKEGQWHNCEPPPSNMTADTSRQICSRRDQLNQIVKKARFASFCKCESVLNPLMWGHYSGGGNGVAICYESSELVLDGAIQLCDVWYEGMTHIGHEDVRDMVDGKVCFLTKGILRSKDPCWSYENEVRIIAKDGLDSLFIKLDPKAIIVGIKDSPEWHVLSAVSHQFRIPIGYLKNRGDGGPGFEVDSQDYWFFDCLSQLK